MRGLLAFILSGLATAACASPQSTEADVVALVRAACIDTDMDRAKFEILASDKGWTPLAFDSGDSGPEWGSGYRLSNGRVMLTGTDSTTKESETALHPAQRTCAVDLMDPQGDWRDDVAVLAEELGYTDIVAPTTSVGEPREVREWNRSGKGILRTAYDPATQVLSIAIVRILDPEVRLFPQASE